MWYTKNKEIKELIRRANRRKNQLTEQEDKALRNCQEKMEKRIDDVFENLLEKYFKNI